VWLVSIADTKFTFFLYHFLHDLPSYVADLHAFSA
jgi:hypothetical protein